MNKLRLRIFGENAAEVVLGPSQAPGGHVPSLPGKAAVVRRQGPAHQPLCCELVAFPFVIPKCFMGRYLERPRWPASRHVLTDLSTPGTTAFDSHHCCFASGASVSVLPSAFTRWNSTVRKSSFPLHLCNDLSVLV